MPALKVRRSPYRIPKTEEMTPYIKDVPVRIYDLIQDFHITLTFAEMDEGQSSAVAAKNKRFTIIVNQDLAEGPRRYAAAYELARLLLNRQVIIDHDGRLPSRLYAQPDNGGRNKVDHEAAKLGASLLLPAAGIRRFHEAGIGPEEIGAAYLATAASVKVRMRQLSLPVKEGPPRKPRRSTPVPSDDPAADGPQI